MGRITDIAPQKRNRNRVSVFIDGEFVCGLDAVTAASARIGIGDEISPDRLIELVFTSEVNSAFERAVGYISLALRSQKEVARYLADRGYDKPVTDAAVSRLVGYGYIDDRAYAESYVRSKSKKYGSFRIAAELKQKGIPAEIIAELKEQSGEDSVTDVARRYLRSHKCADRQKLKRFLASRGFSWDSISNAVAELGSCGAFDNDGDGDDGEY